MSLNVFDLSQEHFKVKLKIQCKLTIFYIYSLVYISTTYICSMRFVFILIQVKQKQQMIAKIPK